MIDLPIVIKAADLKDQTKSACVPLPVAEEEYFFSHGKPKKLVTVSLLLAHSRCCTVSLKYAFLFPSLIKDLHLK